MVKVLLYCYYPFFESHLGGGVQVWLRTLLEEINRSNEVRVDVVCPKSDLHPLYNSDCVHPVIDDMEVNGMLPESYYHNLSRIKELADSSDVLWIVDRKFPIASDKPLLLSLNTICYEREVKAFFENTWKKVFVLSEFERTQLISTTENPEDILRVPFYIDSIFEKKDFNKSVKCLEKYFICEPDKKYILFPHRPEKEKGVEYAIEMLKNIIKKDDSYRLLIPRQPDSRVSDLKKESEFISNIEKFVQDNQLSEYVIFHDWIEYNDLPYYYSIGKATLFLSKLPETFGLTLINSVACGTPVISFGSGALPETLPPGRSHRIITTIDEMENAILSEEFTEIDKDIEFISESYSLSNIVDTYISIFKELKNEI